MSASNTDNFMQVAQAGTETTLTAPGKAIGAGSVNLTNVGTGWPTATGIVMALRRVDANGNYVAGTYTEWAGVQSGGVVTLNTTPLYGSDQVYAADGLTQAFIPVSYNAWNRLINTLLADHSQNGGHGTLHDLNSNVILKLNPISSAVNDIVIQNAATGNTPLIQSEGSDSNVGLHISGKGTSSPHFFGIYDGWVNPNETWTYSSYDSTNKTGIITVPTGAANKYNAGDRVKFTNNSSIQYGIVTKVADTALTVYFGTDYSLTNSAITLDYYSHEGSPVGFNADPTKWTQSVTSSATTALTGSWSNAGAINLSIPIGAWKIFGNATANSTRTSATASEVSCMLSESATAVTTGYETTIDTMNTGGASGSIIAGMTFRPNIDKTFTTATTVYLDFITVATTGNLYVARGNVHGIRAVCAYL